MTKRKDGQARGKYTREFKLEAVRLVKGGQAVPQPVAVPWPRSERCRMPDTEPDRCVDQA